MSEVGEYPDSYYAATAVGARDYPTLEDHRQADVCVIGGGFSLRGRSYFERCRFYIPPMPSEEEPIHDVPWNRLTMFERMNNVVPQESFGDRTVTREPNGRISIMCTVTSKAPDSESHEVVHELIQNSWETPHWREECHPFLRDGPRRRLSPHELRGPADECE